MVDGGPEEQCFLRENGDDLAIGWIFGVRLRQKLTVAPKTEARRSVQVARVGITGTANSGLGIGDNWVFLHPTSHTDSEPPSCLGPGGFRCSSFSHICLSGGPFHQGPFLACPPDQAVPLICSFPAISGKPHLSRGFP